jgi:hypothetical protein
MLWQEKGTSTAAKLQERATVYENRGGRIPNRGLY